MAEIGIVASIVGVAGAGFRLSLILNAISCEVANAPSEIHAISKTVTLYSLMLKQIGTVLQAADSVHSSEAVQAADQVATESNRVFDEISNMLDRVRTKMPDGTLQPTISQRFKWCFKKNRINYLLAQLESLKLSLSLMLQILSLGTLMAATSKNDPPERVKHNNAAMQQERLEVRNLVILRHIQIDETDRLFRRCEVDEDLPLSLPSSPEADRTPYLAIEPLPEYLSHALTVQLSRPSLGDVDALLTNLRQSSKDMVQISERAIDPLLSKWTRWNEVREARHRRKPYAPYVDIPDDEEAEASLLDRLESRDVSPRGYYLEGTTTDWRRPHSLAAKQDYLQRRKKYASYQASASPGSSDVEDSPASNSSNRRRTKKHVINSSSDSSDPEGQKPIRRDSVVSNQEKMAPQVPMIKTSSNHLKPAVVRMAVPQPTAFPLPPPPPPPPASSSLHPPQSLASSANPGDTGKHQQSTYMPPNPPQYVPLQYQQRPYTTPDQQRSHHSLSSPLPPTHTYNAPHPYANQPGAPVYSPSQLPAHGRLSPQPRGHDRAFTEQQYNNSQYMSSRPTSRPMPKDTRPRSPSRLSAEYSPNDRTRLREDRDERDGRGDRYAKYDRYDRNGERKKKDKTKGLRSGAAKGLIGAGAIAGFLEALEGLDL